MTEKDILINLYDIIKHIVDENSLEINDTFRDILENAKEYIEEFL